MTSRFQVFGALRHSRYRRVWGAGLVSQLGDWMQIYGRGVLAYALTGKASAVGLVVFFTYIPQFIFNLYPGVFADRFDRRRLLIATQFAQAGGAGCLAILIATHHANIINLCAVAFFMGVAFMLAIPVEQALAPVVVPREELSSAISLSSATNSLTRVFGPLLATLVFAIGGLTWVFAINAISFSGVIFVWLITPVEKQTNLEGQGNTAALKEGLRYVMGTPAVWVPIAIGGFLNAIGVIYQPLSPVFAQRVLAMGNVHLGNTYNGWIQSAIGIGAAVGILGLAGIGRRRPGPTLLTTAIGFSFLLVGFGFVHAVPLALMLCVGMGALQFANLALAVNLVQHEVPEELRGRVMSVQMTALLAFVPLTSLIGGTLADAVGISTVIAWAGVLCVVFSIVSLRWMHHVRQSPVGEQSYETAAAVTHVLDEEA
jgi:MFS family permease